MNQLGSNLHASFFLQKLLEVTKGQASTYLLQEEIFSNISLLAFSEVNFTLPLKGSHQMIKIDG